MQTFKKSEKLISKKLINYLFEKGKVIHHHPFKVLFDMVNNDVCTCHAQIGISVSKKNFKRAVDRNRIKRKIREVYRLNKQLFYEELENSNQEVVFFVIYTATAEEDYSNLNLEMAQLLKKILVRLGM